MPPLGKKAVEIILLVFIWYFSAIFSIISSKSAMMICPAPFLLCLTQFSAASILTRLYYYYQNRNLGIVSTIKSPGTISPIGSSSVNKPFPKITKPVVVIAVCYTLGFILTNIAFSLSNANSVETVKAGEPISSVVLGQIFCPEYSSFWTYASLIPIWFGVSMACYGDDAFPFWGVFFAMLSNFCFSGRAVATTRLYTAEAVTDETVLFSQISVVGLVILIPSFIIFDYGTVAEHPWGLKGVDDPWMIPRFISILFINGVAYTAYNLASFYVLNRTNLVTHAVLNACRRVVIIVSTAWYFSVYISTMNVYGIGIAILGVVWFSVSKMLSSKSSVMMGLLPQYVKPDAPNKE